MDTHCITKCHSWGNSIWLGRGFEPMTFRLPYEQLYHRANEPHARSTISLYLIRFISETMLKSWIQSLCCPQPKMDQQWATKGRKIVNELSTGWEWNQWPSACKSKSRPHRYKRWLVPLCSSMRYIHNTDTYSDILRWYLSPSVVRSFQICKICFCIFIVRSFRDGLPVHSFTFVDLKRRILDRRCPYTDWQKKRYNQIQSCFILAVISSNYVEIN